MSSLKVTGLRSVVIYCDCGSEHKLTVDKEGEYHLATTPKNPKPGPTGKPAATPKPKRSIFDAPIPGNDEEEEEETDD